MRGGIAALAAACVMALIPAVPASAAGPAVSAGEPCDISYRPTPGNEVFDVYLVIRNTSGYEINGWTLAFVLPPGQSFVRGSEYEVNISTADQAVDGWNKPWNGTVVDRGTVGLGFKVRGPNWQIEPTEFLINGKKCSVSP
ncbi:MULTISPECIES: cellulose binding domain-containing protein [Catenuloplanes]|uniref:CBM2 domain-containing protein n=1 Tax=Catenuloplanes niger TaxID=587534 RepID=A0AAE4CXG6_9ACTN|nr:cellulose binding domain-containing protein [Catenuloplanes niger]MDR7326578.1 hypothetical protein [Catenuloplanes niger]